MRWQHSSAAALDAGAGSQLLQRAAVPRSQASQHLAGALYSAAEPRMALPRPAIPTHARTLRLVCLARVWRNRRGALRTADRSQHVRRSLAHDRASGALPARHVRTLPYTATTQKALHLLQKLLHVCGAALTVLFTSVDIAREGFRPPGRAPSTHPGRDDLLLRGFPAAEGERNQVSLEVAHETPQSCSTPCHLRRSRTCPRRSRVD